MAKEADFINSLIEDFKQHRLVRRDGRLPDAMLNEMEQQQSTTVQDFVQLLAESAPVTGDIAMAEDAAGGDRVAQVLSGLSALPFVGAGVKGVRRLRPFFHGTGNQAALESILEEGFKRGRSYELQIPGTSVSEDPLLSLNTFAFDDIDNMLKAVPDVDPSQVVNLRPSEYLGGVVPDSPAYRKPNFAFNEAETFFPRRLDPKLARLWNLINGALVDDNSGNLIKNTPSGIELSSTKGRINPETRRRLEDTAAKISRKEEKALPKVHGERLNEKDISRINKDLELMFEVSSGFERKAATRKNGLVSYEPKKRFTELVSSLRDLRGNKTVKAKLTDRFARALEEQYSPDARVVQDQLDSWINSGGNKAAQRAETAADLKKRGREYLDKLSTMDLARAAFQRNELDGKDLDTAVREFQKASRKFDDILDKVMKQ